MSRRGQGAMSDEGMMKKKGAGGGHFFNDEEHGSMYHSQATAVHPQRPCHLG